MIIDSTKTFKIISRTLSHVDQRLLDHGERVAFIVQKMLELDGGYTPKEIRDIVFVSLLHDIGAYKTEEIDNMVQFETDHFWDHSIYGYLFVKHLSPFAPLASAILYHHVNYNKLETVEGDYLGLAQIINLADRVDVWLGNGLLCDTILSELDSVAGIKFSQDVIRLFKKAENKCDIIKRLQSKGYIGQIQEILHKVPFEEEKLENFLQMLIYTIDFRSQYTVTHTIITTRIAVELAHKFKLNERLCKKIRYGALLHDLGKIGIAVEILESPVKLSTCEMNKMKTHVDLTNDIMAGDIDLETAQIALRHHEKLDGSGYPEGLSAEGLTLPQRIVAVADIVSALSGKRSYKEAFDKEKILMIITHMKDNGELDPQVVDMMVTHFEPLMKSVVEHCKPVLSLYDNINLQFGRLMEQFNGF